MSEHLELGAVVPALFIDGFPETPWVVGTLTLTDSGVRVALPYVRKLDQFKTVNEWIDGETPPANLQVESMDLRMSLFGLRYSGHSQNLGQGTGLGLIDVEEAVMQPRDGELQDPLLVEKVESEIDGLIEWSLLSSVTSSFSSMGEGRDYRNTFVYTVTTADGLAWKQGDVTLSISTSWDGDNNQGISVYDRGVLISTFDEPRAFKDHLAEQRKFVGFLSIMFGTPIAFRKHKIQDSRFTLKTMDGTVRGYPHVELISRQTIRDYATQKPSAAELRFPLINMPLLSPETLTKWGENYERWARFLLPAVGVLGMRDVIIENRAINSAMSLEAFAKGIVTSVAGESATYQNNRAVTATYIYRGLKNLGLNWEAIAVSEVGLARAIARNYNSIKHPGSQDFPDAFHTRTLTQISIGVNRLNALKLVASEEEYAKADVSSLFREAIDVFRLNNLYIDGDGRVIERPTEVEHSAESTDS